MIRTLYLFVTSIRPDQYVNPAIHCIKHENVSNITFVYINDSRESVLKAKEKAQIIRDKVISRIDELSNGTYTKPKKPTKDDPSTTEVIPLKDVYPPEQLEAVKNFYKSIHDNRDITWKCDAIEYSFLDKELSKIKKRDSNCIFDVTALNKVYLGAILAVSIIKDIQEIYTFELQILPNFELPWSMLIHELDTNEDKYEYANIVKAPIFTKSTNSILVRGLPLKIALVSTFALVAILLAANYYYGATNWITQIVTILSVVFSLLAAVIIFIPLRRD